MDKRSAQLVPNQKKMEHEARRNGSHLETSVTAPDDGHVIHLEKRQTDEKVALSDPTLSQSYTPSESHTHHQRGLLYSSSGTTDSETIETGTTQSTVDDVGNGVVRKRKDQKRHKVDGSEDIISSKSARKGTKRVEVAAAKEETELKYGAQHIIKLFVPVSLSMSFVVISMNTIYANQPYERQEGGTLALAPFYKDSSVDTQSPVLNSALNAVVIVAVVIVMSVALVILVIFRCWKVMQVWLFVSTMIFYVIFCCLFLSDLFRAVNVPFDWLTAAVIVWNWTVVGLICVFWKGPLFMQQFYLVAGCSVMAMFFVNHLPGWTSWFLLGLIALWDLFAVLAPCGPLRILIEKAQERNEDLAAGLVYSSGVMLGTDIQQSRGATTADSSGRETLKVEENKEKNKEERNGDHPEIEKEKVTDKNPRKGMSESSDLTSGDEAAEGIDDIKLGLGDFIFYSLLVGKASAAGDWNTTLACLVAILVGLALTLILLSLFKKALPALPVSIATGLIFYFGTSEIVSPFCSELAYRQIFL